MLTIYKKSSEEAKKRDVSAIKDDNSYNSNNCSMGKN